ncbi:unnamed protein product [Lactuca saligna]|uniref:GB1/RHD3-type G domain-containing protein n=1 Tax=Lactuca saligna TaxID=75948 RepID=A0AA35ZS70_LACSI|nr:unnamed protein product [Lactuca saligna]
MESAASCCSTHLIDGDGTFNAAGLEKFMKEVKLSECGLSYAIVSIMGPQSSGKSTLLNHLFHTNFLEMDAFKGRSQTTKGIWMARCTGIEPCTVVMDLEGTDGRERGEDDTAFEKQSALFALAVSDIVLINMWCHDIGREHAANKPLLKTVFQVYHVYFFSSYIYSYTGLSKYSALIGRNGSRMLEYTSDDTLFSPRKTTLIFVIRDKTRTPLENLEPVLREDIQKQADWDSSKARVKLSHDIDSHIADVKTAKISDLTALYESKVKTTLYGPVEALLEGAADDTWHAIRKLLRNESETAVFEFSDALSGLEMEESAKKNLLSRLENYAVEVVEGKTKEEAAKVLNRMKERFTTIFNHDNDLMPRVWTGKEDIRAINKTARTSSLKLLSVLAAIRLEDYGDKIQGILLVALADPAQASDKNSNVQDPLATSKWEKIPADKTLITPVQCKSLWTQFQKETEYAVSQAISAQKANKQNNNWMPPPWAILALFVLGFNEFITLLRNPLYLILIFITFLLIKALWVQMDIASEFQHGVFHGFLSLSTKLIPTILNLIRKLSDAGQRQPPPH